jgi:cytochrome c oxidase cbb3-type subunit 3
VRILNASIDQIQADSALRRFMESTAQAAYTQHCASCHKADFKGGNGVPDLTDTDLLWGSGAEEEMPVGTVREIERTILYGVRNQACPDSDEKKAFGACLDTRYSVMVDWGKSGVHTAAEIHDLTEYVLSLGKQQADPAAVKRAAPIFAEDCVECHGPQGYGVQPYGGPNLTDDIWLFGGDRKTIYDVIFNGRLGVCPPWGKTLDAATIKSLAAFLYEKSQSS